MIRDVVFAILLIVASVIGYIKVENLSFTSSFFPEMVCVVLTTLVFIDITLRIVKRIIKKQSIKKKNLFIDLFADKAGVAIILILLYIVILKDLGFIASSILFIGLLSLYIKKVSRVLDILKIFTFSFLVTLFFYFIFYHLFNIQLPRGIISW